ncbi:hypothetical protein BC938DRAFT_473280 [Jimgerdemannia flammicorona]|uniref:Uncharacterized protein n=1 Tax=Jimgerdemannia flammicorona TaxID=994334 RepID=A0A433Q4A2_9FUNG|nr:hypothetical protein BC938DRAFT_473280 [Jimgerdemannia flammicorona]
MSPISHHRFDYTRAISSDGFADSKRQPIGAEWKRQCLIFSDSAQPTNARGIGTLGCMRKNDGTTDRCTSLVIQTSSGA